MRYRLKIREKNPLQPVWTGPHTVVLATPIAVKVTGVSPWTHYTRVKKAAASCDEDPWKAVWDPRNPLKVRFQKQRPSPMTDAEPCCSLSGSWLAHAQPKHEGSSAWLQPHSGSWSMHIGSLKIWLSKYQWIFIVNPGSTPDCYYCRALCYRTSFSHTPGLGLGSEAAVSCLLSHHSGKPHSY